MPNPVNQTYIISIVVVRGVVLIDEVPKVFVAQRVVVLPLHLWQLRSRSRWGCCGLSFGPFQRSKLGETPFSIILH